MRDVVNKNVTEAHIERARVVCSRAAAPLKLYFMIGLPTERTMMSAGSSRPASACCGSAASWRGTAPRSRSA